MKRFFLNILVCLLALPVCATSIVIYVTPNYILMGADSRRMIIDEKANLTVIESVCKIRKAGSYCYALAGFVASRSTFFSADSIIAVHLANETDYSKAVKNITRDIRKALRKEFAYQKENNPQVYQKMLLSKEHILEVAILSVRNNKPFVQIVGFELADEERIKVKDYTASCPGDCPNDEKQFYLLGDYAGIEKYLERKEAIADPVMLVEKLITLQSHATPNSVGTPINMIRYSAEGVEWIR